MQQESRIYDRTYESSFVELKAKINDNSSEKES